MLILSGKKVLQGNGNGQILQADDENTVLVTFDMGPCAAVCGYNGEIAFMIHSDSTGTKGIGKVELIEGLQSLVGEIGAGEGFRLTVVGGSPDGTLAYLSRHLHKAEITRIDPSDSAYNTWNGKAVPNKRQLAELLDVDAVCIQ